MSRTRVIAIGAGAAFVDVPSTIGARRVTITEIGAQGLDVKYPSDNFTAIIPEKIGVPIELGSPTSNRLLGLPDQSNPATGGVVGGPTATILAKVRATSALATSIRVYETE